MYFEVLLSRYRKGTGSEDKTVITYVIGRTGIHGGSAPGQQAWKQRIAEKGSKRSAKAG